MENLKYVKTATGDVINNDNSELLKYKQARIRAKRHNKLEERVGQLEAEISKLKTIIQDLHSKVQ